MTIGELKDLIKDIPNDAIVSGLRSIHVFGPETTDAVLDINDNKLSYCKTTVPKVVLYIMSFSDFIANNIDVYQDEDTNAKNIKKLIEFKVDADTSTMYENMISSTIHKLWKDRFTPRRFFLDSKNSQVILLNEQ